MCVGRTLMRATGVLVGVLWSFSAHALIVDIDTFTVTKNNVALSDEFVDGDAPPAGPLAPNPPGYFVRGSFPPGSESGGMLTLNTANGIFSVNALGEARRTLDAVLLTSTTNPDFALWVDDDIAVSAVFDLVVPAGPLFNAYGLQLIDSSATQELQQILQLFVSFQPTTGLPTVAYINQNFVSNTILSFGAFELAPPSGAEQILLELTRLRDEDTGELTDSFHASYAFLDSVGDTIASNSFVNLGVMFDGEDFVRARFFAATALPVPEPATLALLLAGIAGLTLLRRSRVA